MQHVGVPAVHAWSSMAGHLCGSCSEKGRGGRSGVPRRGWSGARGGFGVGEGGVALNKGPRSGTSPALRSIPRPSERAWGGAVRPRWRGTGPAPRWTSAWRWRRAGPSPCPPQAPRRTLRRCADHEAKGPQTPPRTSRGCSSNVRRGTCDIRLVTYARCPASHCPCAGRTALPDGDLASDGRAIGPPCQGYLFAGSLHHARPQAICWELRGQPPLPIHTHTHTPTPPLWAKTATIHEESFASRLAPCFRPVHVPAPVQSIVLAPSVHPSARPVYFFPFFFPSKNGLRSWVAGLRLGDGG